MNCSFRLDEKAKTIPVTGSGSPAMQEEKNSRKCTSLESTPRNKTSSPPKVSNGHTQPDIVASAVGRSKARSLQRATEIRKSEPVAPPRRKKVPIPTRNFFSRTNEGGVGAAKYEESVLENRRSLDGLLLNEDFDSGKEIPIKEAPDKKLSSIDPITFHALRRMSLYSGYAESKASMDSDASSVCSEDLTSVKSMPITPDKFGSNSYLAMAKHSALRYRRSLGKKMGKAFQETAKTVKTAAGGVSQKLQGVEESSQSEEEDSNVDVNSRQIRVRSRQKKGPYDFELLKQVQDLANEHTSAVWSLKFSICGRLLASAGQDNIIRIWCLKDAYDYFNEMRLKYNRETRKANTSATLSNVSADSFLSDIGRREDESEENSEADLGEEHQDDMWSPFAPKPFCLYKGHTADVLDIAWSKSYFLLSGSMDRTVRLWHISRTECLCVFQHIDFVTSVAFLPKDDKFFLSGSLDGKLRVWNITEKKVALWNEVEGSRLITALAFVNNGKYAVVGTFDGKCFFYTTDQLKYHTTIDVKSTRGKNARGHKITGLAVYPDRSRGDKLLVTSSDSRIRLYDLSNLSLTCKYKGASNYSSQISGNFSPDGRHVICGSEDRYIYFWRTSLDTLTLSVRKDRNGMWERVRADARMMKSMHSGVISILRGVSKVNVQCLAGAKRGLEGEAPLAHKKREEDKTDHGVFVPGDSKFHVGIDLTNADTAWKQYGYPEIKRDWWNEKQRFTKWQNYRMRKDVRRRKGVEEWGPMRLRLKVMKDCKVFPQAFRDKAAEELHNLPKDSCWNLVRNRCQFTSRQRGGVKPFRLARMNFRDLADHGKLSGVIRAKW